MKLVDNSEGQTEKLLHYIPQFYKITNIVL